MPVRISIPSAHPSLRPFKAALLKYSRLAAKKAEHVLPLSRVDIVLSVDPDGAVQEVGGIGGYTPDAHRVLISLDPGNPQFKKAIATALPETIAHELHHAARWHAIGYGDALLEALVTEGLADQFVRELFPKSRPFPWTRALSSKRADILLKRAKRVWKKRYDHEAWFFGSTRLRIPRWTGYTLGYRIVGDYLKRHPDAKPSECAAMPAAKFL